VNNTSLALDVDGIDQLNLSIQPCAGQHRVAQGLGMIACVLWLLSSRAIYCGVVHVISRFVL
jgi:hypothetical protein